MFCPKCGLDNKDIARFCKTCGTPLTQSLAQSQPDIQPGMNYTNIQTPAAAMPGAYGMQPEKKAIKPATVAILAIIVAAVLVFVFVVTPMLKPKNPIAALYDGYKGLMTSEGYDGSFVTSSEYGKMEAYISYRLGEDVMSTMFDVSTIQSTSFDDYEYTDWFRVMMFDGEFAYGKDYSSDDDYDYMKKEMANADNFYRYGFYGYNPLDDLEEDLEYMLGTSVPLNRLISDNHIDWETIWKLIDDSLAYAVNDYMLDYIGLSSIPKMSSMQALFEDFVYNYCSNKDVMNKVTKNLKKSGNTYSFSFDTRAYFEAFGDYLSDLKDDEKALDKMGLKRTEVRAFESLINLALPSYESYLSDYVDEYFSDTDSVIEFSVNRGILERIVWTSEIDGEATIMEFSVKNVNNPSVGNKDFESFFSEIEES